MLGASAAPAREPAGLAALVSEMPPPPPIALDLAPALPKARAGDGQTVIKVEGVAQGAALSAGRNNGDRTWSITPDEIAGLTYTLAHGPLMPHTLQVRVLSIADDQASTQMLLETDIGTDGQATPLRLFGDAAPSQPTDSGDGDDLETAVGLSKAISQS
ncbi:MAG: hypothetical protein VW644_09080, partial [Alphaproteobacteria bacterium]